MNNADGRNSPDDRLESLIKAVQTGGDQGARALKVNYEAYLLLAEVRDLLFLDQTTNRQAAHQNPINRMGRKCFSQSDEDGITLEILKRIGKLDAGVFVEFGIGNGLENNTLVLAALGWRGIWVGNEDLAVSLDGVDKTKFSFAKTWITRDNAAGVAQRGLLQIGADVPNLVSVDLDGNDLHVLRALLEADILPDVYVAEYNGKFPPPVRFEIEYDPEHVWRGDDHFGASLCSLDDLFSQFGYRLVCCNSQTGNNAFFVRHDHCDKFADIPADLEKIYVPPRLHLGGRFGHSTSTETARLILSRL